MAPDRGSVITTGGILKLRKRPGALLPKLKQNSENVELSSRFSEAVPNLVKHSLKVRSDHLT
jgi:hypothetical protein